jgi:hypothetical protein
MATAPELTESTIEIVDLDAIITDSRYQRPLNENRVADMAANFDPRLCGPLVVSARPNDKFAVFDGQHRLAALRLLGKEEAWYCQVHHRLSAKQEAGLFILLQTQRRGVVPIDRHRAAVFAGEALPMKVENLITECGYRITTNRTHGALTCVSGLYMAYERFGPGSLRRGLKVIEDAWGLGDGYGRKAPMVIGMALFMNRTSDKTTGETKIDMASFVEKLSGIKSASIIRDSQMQGGTHTTVYVKAAMQLRDIYNKQRTVNRINPNFGR